MVKMKRFLGMLIFLLTVLGAEVFADSGVYDKGSLFTAEETAELEKDADRIAQEYDMNIFLLTTLDAEGMTSAGYAEDFYESGNYHENGASGGIVLLIDMEHRELNLVTYGDMIYYITDEREERIYDAGFDEVSQEKYGDSMAKMLQATEKYLEQGIPDDQYTYDEETGESVYYHKSIKKSLDGMEILLAFAAAAVCALVPCLILWRRYSSVKEYDYSVTDNADMHLRFKEDHMIDMIVTHRKKPDPDDGGGHSGSGTTVHHSSGGSSVGGGHGRSF